MRILFLTFSVDFVKKTLHRIGFDRVLLIVEYFEIRQKTNFGRTHSIYLILLNTNHVQNNIVL